MSIFINVYHLLKAILSIATDLFGKLSEYKWI